MSAFWALVRRDLGLSFGGVGTAIGFYLLVVSILPLGLGPDLNLLARIAPGLLWVALLLSALLSSDRIFQDDYDDGTLELLTLGPLPLELIVVAKSLAHWISTGIPLMLCAPLLGLLLNLDSDGYGVLLLTMAVGSPAISFFGAIGAALTMGLRRGGLLLSLLILPLYVPVLIFGIASMNAVLVGPGSFTAPFSLLCAVSLGTIILAPWAAAAGLRLNLQ